MYHPLEKEKHHFPMRKGRDRYFKRVSYQDGEEHNAQSLPWNVQVRNVQEETNQQNRQESRKIGKSEPTNMDTARNMVHQLALDPKRVSGYDRYGGEKRMSREEKYKLLGEEERRRGKMVGSGREGVPDPIDMYSVQNTILQPNMVSNPEKRVKFM